MRCILILLVTLPTSLHLSSARAQEDHGQYIRTHVELLAADSLEGRLAGSQGNQAAGNYITTKLREYDVKPIPGQPDFYQLFGDGYRNIIGFIKGQSPRDDSAVLYGAHYDHVGYGSKRTSLGEIGLIHNGADDNASGVSAILELCRHWKHQPPQQNVVIVLWDAEELGLLGSKHFAKSPTFPMERISLAINVDMIGQLTDGTLEVHGWRSGIGLRSLIANANLEHRIPLEYKDQIKANSDHYAFLDSGIPAVMFHTGLHDRYHRPTDDAETLDYSGASRIMEFILELANAIDQRDTTFAYRDGCLQDNRAQIRLHDIGITELLHKNGLYAQYVNAKPAHLQVTRVSNPNTRPRNWPSKGSRVSAICDIPIDDIQRLSNAFQKLTLEPTLTFTDKRSAMRKTIKLVPIESSSIAGAYLVNDLGDDSAYYVRHVLPKTNSARMRLEPGDVIIPKNAAELTVPEWLSKPRPRDAVFVERNGVSLEFK